MGDVKHPGPGATPAPGFLTVSLRKGFPSRGGIG